MIVSRSSPHPFRRALNLAVVAIVALFVGSGALADVTSSKSDKDKKKSDDKKKPMEFVPEAREAAATFVSGESVNIELTAAVSTMKQVEFIVRSQPQNGTLSAVRPHPTETNKGVITYTHRGNGAPLADKFTFACRVDGGPVSAAATVTLTGRKFEPILAVEDIAVIDKVFLGGEATFRFTLKNTGAAPFDGDFAWPAPWRGPPHVTLKPGEKAPFVVQFKPDRAGIFRQEMILQPGVESSKLPLFGECVRALTVAPGQLVLTLNPESHAREGVLTLSNGKSDPVRIKVRAPERIDGAASELEIPARGKTRLLLHLPADDVSALKGEIEVQSPDGTEKVGITAAARPAELRLIAPAEGPLSLGIVAAGAQGKGEIRLRNTGGATAVVQAQTVTPFIVTPSGQAVRIEPGAETAFSVFGRGDQPGHVKGEIVVHGGPVDLKVPVSVEVTAPDSPPASDGGGKQPTTSAAASSPIKAGGLSEAKQSAVKSSLLAYLATSGLPISPEAINPYLEQIKELTILSQKPNSITVAWKKPSIEPAGWALECSSLVRVGENKTYVKIWNPISNWKTVDAGADRVAVQIHSLPPGTQFEVRIMAKDREGKLSQPGAFSLSTTMPEPMSSWVWIILSAAALGIVLYILLRIRNGEMEWPWLRKAGSPTRF